jgi:hypothetical protein
MAEEAADYLNIRRELEGLIRERLRPIEETLGLLDDRVSGVQRALVELRAFLISRGIVSDLSMRIVFKCLKEGVYDEDMAREQNAVGNELRVALASLRGKLGEGGIPEDVLKDWTKDARKRLSGIVGREEAESLIPSASDWGKIIGLCGLDVEE